MKKRQHKGAIASARLAILRQKLEKGEITEKEYKFARNSGKKVKQIKEMGNIK